MSDIPSTLPAYSPLGGSGAERFIARLGSPALIEAIRRGQNGEAVVGISLAIAVIAFANVFNRINDTELDFPSVASSAA